jgi:hypothetical protein
MSTLEKFFAVLPPDIGSMARRRQIAEALLEVVVQTETEFETRLAALEKERRELGGIDGVAWVGFTD